MKNRGFGTASAFNMFNASEEELQKIKVKPALFHGDWNYSISPHI
jgi:hypothetical protein